MWSCKPLNQLWGKKRYYFKEKDFCRNQWSKKFNPSARPRCSKKIAPAISFYHQNNEDVPICKVDMNDGNNDVFQQCLKIISSHKRNGMITVIIMSKISNYILSMFEIIMNFNHQILETWLVYLVHGFSADEWSKQLWYPSSRKILMNK